MAPERTLRRAAVLLLAAGCAPAPSALRAAITNGSNDTGDPAVAAIVSSDGVLGCTGTLIAPHSLLTAAHCLVLGMEASGYQVVFGPTVAGGMSDALVDLRAHPQYDPSTLANDLALLTLVQPGPGAPVGLQTAPIDASLVGSTLTVIGFGASSATAIDVGQKRSGTTKLSAVGAGDFTTMPSPSQPCAGDSGGPALLSGLVAGVTSHGDAGCSDHSVFARVDVAQAGFIQPYLASIAAGSANVGDRCFFAEQCASGSCLTASDEPKRSYCSRPCASRNDCPPAMTCAPDGCRYAPPSPGAIGATCVQDGDCVSAICWQGACARSCVANGQDCPSGFVCTNVKDITFYCVAAHHSGCAFGGAPSGGVVWLLLLLFLLKRSSAR